MGDIPDRATVQMARMKVATVAGTSTCLVKIPALGRKINGGLAWFETPHFDDILKVFVTDEDNLLGAGAGTVIAGYTDLEVPADNQGWFLAKNAPYITIERLVEFGTLPGNMYLKIVGITGDARVDTLRVNLHWGKIG